MQIITRHTGQYHAYGDSFYEHEIHLEDGENPTEQEILENVNNGSRLPRSQWSMSAGADIYFKGYYVLTKTDYGYYYKGCDPYTD